MPLENGNYTREEVEAVLAQHVEALKGRDQVITQLQDERRKDALNGQAALDEAHNAVKERDQALAGVTRTLHAREQEVAALEEAAKTATAQIEARFLKLQEGLKQAAAKYRELVLQVHPDLPSELVAGEDVPSIEASVAHARAIVDKVRAGLEELARKNAAPPGSPPRRGPDVDSLSPTEKIKLGLRNGH